MAMLQRTRLLANQRLDKTDYDNIEKFVCADFAAIHKNLWSKENQVLSGFEASGETSNTLTVVLAGSSIIFGENLGKIYIGAGSLSDITTSDLAPGTRNYVELVSLDETGGADTRSFWDQNSETEFNQVVDTYIFQDAELEISTSGFSGDPSRVPLCYVDVSGGGAITKIVDQRPMFWRLGKVNNPGYSFVYTNGRNAEDSLNPEYSDPDKSIGTLKEWADAIMSAVREIKGTTYWYEAPTVSLTQSFTMTGLSTLTGLDNTARIAWTGSEVQFTDDNVSPVTTDVIAYIRFLNSTANMELTRESIPMADGDVLYVEIPEPVYPQTYSTLGSSSNNYQVSPRGSIPTDSGVFWLAFRDGNRLYVRGLGELEPGEAAQVSDDISIALQTWLGFDPESATSVPYTELPDPVLFSNLFSATSTLVEAISTNTANINNLGEAIKGNIYAERLQIVSGAPADDFELTGPTSVSQTITLPPDTRGDNLPRQYLVGTGQLKVFHDGLLLAEGEDYLEVGAVDTLSDQITLLKIFEVNERLTFRVDTLGGFQIGAAGGGDVTGAQNLGGGEGNSFIGKVTGTLRFRTIKSGPGISVTQVGDQIVLSVTTGAPTPYYKQDTTGQVTTLVNTGGPYNVGQFKLDVYRNGVLMYNSTALGDPEDRYQETVSGSVSLATIPDINDVYTFVNRANESYYKADVAGATGTNLPVPSYTVGNDSLKIFRNGVLMNNAALGGIEDQYTEIDGNTIQLTQAAVANEVFTIISTVPPTFIERLTSQTGLVLTISNIYPPGTGQMLVYKNGVLMFPTTGLGDPEDQYSETTTSSITLESPAEVTDVFTFVRY